MIWRSEWGALSIRIKSLMEAANFYMRAQAVSSEDSKQVGKKHIFRQATETNSALLKFFEAHRKVLPEAAGKRIESFLKDNEKHFKYENIENTTVASQIRPHLILACTALATFEAEFSFLLSDFSAITKSITERAFIHLKRTVAIDGQEREKWREVFASQREENLEQLGAIHLLWFGIWPFKADSATGGKTDLIFREPVERIISRIENAADALVHTEWKKVNDNKEIDKKALEAKEQAKLYTAGVLGGLELHHEAAEKVLFPAPREWVRV